jgi:hypothetical protein
MAYSDKVLDHYEHHATSALLKKATKRLAPVW